MESRDLGVEVFEHRSSIVPASMTTADVAAVHGESGQTRRRRETTIRTRRRTRESTKPTPPVSHCSRSYVTTAPHPTGRVTEDDEAILRAPQRSRSAPITTAKVEGDRSDHVVRTRRHSLALGEGWSRTASARRCSSAASSTARGLVEKVSGSVGEDEVRDGHAQRVGDRREGRDGGHDETSLKLRDVAAPSRRSRRRRRTCSSAPSGAAGHACRPSTRARRGPLGDGCRRPARSFGRIGP